MSYENFVQVLVAAELAVGATTVSLVPATGAYRMPPLDGGTLVLADSMGTPSYTEVVTYTSRTGNTLNGVVRAQEGTVARTWPAGTFCYQSLTAGEFGKVLGSKLGTEAVAADSNKLGGRAAADFEALYGRAGSAGALGFRNKIINGNFDIWQRYGAPVGQGFLADRWNVYLAAGGSLAQDRFALTDQQKTVVGFECRYGLAFYTGDTTSSAVALQPVEGVKTLAGKKAVVSFYAWTNTGTCSIDPQLFQSFGTGGAPSAVVTANSQVSATSVGTMPTLITLTADLPDIAGKTLGSAGNDYLGFHIIKKAGHVGTLYIARVQLEAGEVATPFERRPVGIETALCQRYYEIGSLFVQSPAAASMGGQIGYAVPKRTAPTFTFTNVSYNGTHTLIIQPYGHTHTGMGYNFQATNTSGYLTANWIAEAEL